MSLNIGTKGMEGARALHSNEHWEAVKAAVLEQSAVFMNRALEMVEVERVHDAVGYARALRDVYLAFESGSANVPMNRLVKPGPVERK